MAGISGTTDTPPPTISVASPRLVLEEVIAEALVGPRPSYVAFSGGRDSSAVLALASAVARARDLPLPHPITLRYPGDVESDESSWQELVISHLGLDEWTIIVRKDASTYLDDGVRANLRRRGLIWPAALQLELPELSAASGGMLLTGEGGDEVLGTRRVTPLALMAHFHRRPSAALRRWAADSATPRRATAAAARRDLAGTALEQILTAEGKAQWVRRRVAEDRRPLHWGRETLRMARLRVPIVLAHNHQLVADEHDVVVRNPLQDERFLRALAGAGGRWGFAGRTDLMRFLFADLLPDALVRRSTKAHFGAVRWGAAERDFACRWDGDGVSESLLEPEALRAEWLSDRPSGATALALQAAWLNSEGLPWTGVGTGVGSE